MENINKDFNVPFYIVEELIDYIELSSQGHCKCMKWENIKSLLSLAQINNRLSETQVELIVSMYCKE